MSFPSPQLNLEALIEVLTDLTVKVERLEKLEKVHRRMITTITEAVTGKSLTACSECDRRSGHKLDCSKSLSI